MTTQQETTGVVQLLRMLGDRGWQATQIAKAIKVSESTVSRWKSDESREPRYSWMVEGVLGRLLELDAPPRSKSGPDKGWKKKLRE